MRFWEHEVRTQLKPCVNQIMLYVESAKIEVVPIKYE